MATDSKLPRGENLSRPMQAFLEMIESRKPSDATEINGAATLPEVIARLNTLINDLNKK